MISGSYGASIYQTASENDINCNQFNIIVNKGDYSVAQVIVYSHECMNGGIIGRYGHEVYRLL